MESIWTKSTSGIGALNPLLSMGERCGKGEEQPGSRGTHKDKVPCYAFHEGCSVQISQPSLDICVTLIYDLYPKPRLASLMQPSSVVDCHSFPSFQFLELILERLEFMSEGMRS